MSSADVGSISWHRAARSRLADDRGVAASIVMAPLFFVIVLMMVQGAFWQYDRQMARAAADHASSAIASYGAPQADAESEALELMRSAGIRDISISVSRGADVTVVEVSGDAPGLIPGTSVRVSARSVTPTENLESP